jgi:hypothetical protein
MQLLTEDKSAVKVFVEVKDILWCHQPGLARASSPLRKQFCRKVRALERWFEKAGNSSEDEPRKLGDNELKHRSASFTEVARKRP